MWTMIDELSHSASLYRIAPCLKGKFTQIFILFYLNQGIFCLVTCQYLVICQVHGKSFWKNFWNFACELIKYGTIIILWCTYNLINNHLVVSIAKVISTNTCHSTDTLISLSVDRLFQCLSKEVSSFKWLSLVLLQLWQSWSCWWTMYGSKLG